MYPMLKEGVSIVSFQYEGSDEIHYFVETAKVMNSKSVMNYTGPCYMQMGHSL